MITRNIDIKSINVIQHCIVNSNWKKKSKSRYISTKRVRTIIHLNKMLWSDRILCSFHGKEFVVYLLNLSIWSSTLKAWCACLDEVFKTLSRWCRIDTRPSAFPLWLQLQLMAEKGFCNSQELLIKLGFQLAFSWVVVG